MPFQFDLPNCELSPDDHDQQAIAPGSTQRDLALLLPWLQQAGTGPVLDIGCGTGRHVRALLHAGIEAEGIDLDPRMLARARETDPEAPTHRYRLGDAAESLPGERYRALLVLNRSLVCFHSHRLAWGLFQQAARALRPGGVLLIDNCCTFLWDQVRDGCFADGLSEDGSQQLFFLPGENRFVWRHDQAVDPDCWTVREDDRIYRLWSLGEVALAAAGAGLTVTCAKPDEALIVCRRPDAAAACC
ncbi:MAG: class I SAM-dependent methyltransferase [Planctomycetota bacterium]